MIVARVALAFLVASCVAFADAAVEQQIPKGSSSSLRGKANNRASSILVKDEREYQEQRRSLQNEGGQIEGGDYNEWWYHDNDYGWDDDYYRHHYHHHHPPIESYCWPDYKPDDGSSCDMEGLVCAFDKSPSGNWMTQCRCVPETMRWSCGDFSPLPTPPTQPPAEAPQPCVGAAGCVVSKPLCGPGIYCEDLPNNGLPEQQEQEQQQQQQQDMTGPGDLPPASNGDFGIDFEVNAGAGLPEYEETCAPHESGDGTVVCTFRVKIPTPADTGSITGANRECVYSSELGSDYCYWTQVALDTNGDGIVSPEDLTTPNETAGGDGGGGGVDFDVNAGVDLPTGGADPAYEPTWYYNTALHWAGSGTGVCPGALPNHGDPCAQHVGPNESQRSCTYNFIQCRCTLHNHLADRIGWSCRDTRGGFGP